MIQISGEDCEDMCGIVEEIESGTKKLRKYLKQTAEDYYPMGFKMRHRDEDEEDEDDDDEVTWKYKGKATRKGGYHRY